MIQNIIANISAPVRVDNMEGREFLVAPMIMLTEGVHAGSNGPLLYPSDELAKTPVVWNHKPVVVYHPTMNGQGVSACDPDVITNRKVGVIMNTRFEKGKLHAEAWLDKERANKVDPRILQAIETATVMELSTGLFTDNEAKEGEWNGEKYVAVARNYRPDHLALLPDKKGACSIEDGAGFLRLNELSEVSHEKLRDKVGMALAKYGDVFIEATYDSKVVYSTMQDLVAEPKYFVVGYSMKGDTVEIVGEPEAVVRVSEFRTSSGSFVGNFDSRRREQYEEENMKKEEMVKALIGNSKWTEEDRPFLMGLEEKVLEKMLPVEKTKEELAAEAKAVADAKAKADVEAQSQLQAQNKAKTDEVTADQYIANAPAGIREVLLEGVNAHMAEKNRLVGVIVANKKNVLPKETLEGMEIGLLRNMASLATIEDKKAPLNFSGMAPTATTNEEPLVVPTLKF